MDRCHFEDCRSSSFGGAVHGQTSQMILSGSSFTSCMASHGGAISAGASLVAVARSYRDRWLAGSLFACRSHGLSSGK